MLYVSTRNTLSTFTAHRALFEERTSDGGFYIPFYLPSFSPEEIRKFKNKQVYETISEILNLFFSLRLSASDIENALGTSEFVCESMNLNLTVAELWHTPEGDCDYIFKRLNYLMTGNSEFPVGWTRIAIEIALLFGLLGLVSDKSKFFDMSVTADNLASISAILFAKAMGFPVNLITCACDDNSILWNMVNKSECSTSNIPAYTELFLYKIAGCQSVIEFCNAYDGKRMFFIDESLQQFLNENIYPAVVSNDRAGSIISGMHRTNKYAFDRCAALAYGSLQDYRAIVGANNHTIIFAKTRPERIKE